MLRLRRPGLPRRHPRRRRTPHLRHRLRAPRHPRHLHRMPRRRHRPRTRRRPRHLRRISRPRQQPRSVRRRRLRLRPRPRLPRRGPRWPRTPRPTQRLAHSRQCGLNKGARRPPAHRLPEPRESASAAMNRMPRRRRRMPLRQRRTRRRAHSHKCGPNREVRHPPAHRLPEPRESASAAMNRMPLRERPTRLRAQPRTRYRRDPVRVDRARYRPVAPRRLHAMRRQPSQPRCRRCRRGPRR
jgi:hypothetical protein